MTRGIIVDRWKAYIEALYNEEELVVRDLEKINDNEQDKEYLEYPVLREEFDKVLRDLKLKKAVGIDEIQAELWKEAGENMLNEFFKLIKDIYRTADIPTDFVKSLIIPIPKKTLTIKCEQYRTIRLHASKISNKNYV